MSRASLLYYSAKKKKMSFNEMYGETEPVDYDAVMANGRPRWAMTMPDAIWDDREKIVADARATTKMAEWSERAILSKVENDVEMEAEKAETKKKKKVRKGAKTKAKSDPVDELAMAVETGLVMESPPACPPVSAKAKRTFANLGCDPSGERFAVGDVCARCGHTFSRGMLKDYHFASKNCKAKTPYSKTETGKRGKVGEHAARKVRVADPAMAALVAEMKSWLKYAESDWCDGEYNEDVMYAMSGISQFIAKYMTGTLSNEKTGHVEVWIAKTEKTYDSRCAKTEDLVLRLARAITVKTKTTTTTKTETWVNGVKLDNKLEKDAVVEEERSLASMNTVV